MAFSFGRTLGNIARIGGSVLTGNPLNVGRTIGTIVSENRARRTAAQNAQVNRILMGGGRTSVPVRSGPGAVRRTPFVATPVRVPQSPIRVPAPRIPPQFSPGGGRFGGTGGGGSFGPALPSRPGPGSAAGTDMMQVAIPVQTKKVAAHVPGRVTVTLPFAAFGYPAGSQVSVLKPMAQKLGLYKAPQKPLLTAGDVKTLRKADRVEKKLINATKKYADGVTVMSDSAAASLRRNQKPKSQRK